MTNAHSVTLPRPTDRWNEHTTNDGTRCGYSGKSAIGGFLHADGSRHCPRNCVASNTEDDAGPGIGIS